MPEALLLTGASMTVFTAEVLVWMPARRAYSDWRGAQSNSITSKCSAGCSCLTTASGNSMTSNGLLTAAALPIASLLIALITWATSSSSMTLLTIAGACWSSLMARITWATSSNSIVFTAGTSTKACATSASVCNTVSCLRSGRKRSRRCSISAKVISCGNCSSSSQLGARLSSSHSRSSTSSLISA